MNIEYYTKAFILKQLPDILTPIKLQSTMKDYIQKGSIVSLVIATGLTSFCIPLKVNSINPSVAINSAIEQSFELSGEFMTAAVGGAVTSLKNNPLNVFNLKPLQYLHITAPIFKILPVTPPTTSSIKPSTINIGPTTISPANPKSSSSDLKNSLDQTSTPSPTILPTILKTTSIPEQALINIFCSQKIVVNGKVTNQRRIITGSGILIHQDGTVLTNAHVGQFPLLSEKNPNIACLARHENPASGAIGMKVAFISPEWIKDYGKYINTEGAAQTGKSDFALLKLNLDNLTKAQKALLSPITIQRNLPNLNETIYSLSYPADILGTKGVNSALSRQKETLSVNRLYSVGVTPNDVIETTASTAGQRGSSGGGILDTNGHLIGTITTIVNSSVPSKTLIRAMTLDHTDFELTRLSNISLAKVVTYGSTEVTQVFDTKYREYLTSLLSNYLNSL